MLLFQEGSFIQVLEGDQQAVESLFPVLSQDTRHKDTNVVLRTWVEERAFDHWSMGYKRTATIDDVPEGFHYFLQHGFRQQKDLEGEAARKAQAETAQAPVSARFLIGKCAISVYILDVSARPLYCDHKRERCACRTDQWGHSRQRRHRDPWREHPTVG